MKQKVFNLLMIIAVALTLGQVVSLKVAADTDHFEPSQGIKFENARSISAKDMFGSSAEDQKKFWEDSISLNQKSLEILEEIKDLLKQIEQNTR